VIIVPGLSCPEQQIGIADPSQWIEALSLDRDAVTKIELFIYPQATSSTSGNVDAIETWSQILLDGLENKLADLGEDSHTKLLLCCQGLGGGIITDYVSVASTFQMHQC
jgi:hypothetical protein